MVEDCIRDYVRALKKAKEKELPIPAEDDNPDVQKKLKVSELFTMGSSSFKSPSRVEANQIQEDYLRTIPGAAYYRPKFQLILHQAPRAVMGKLEHEP